MTTKLTKQGVRDLNAGTPRSHTHRFAPTTYVNRSGFQVTAMRCWCGAEPVETPAEARERIAAQEDARIERLEAEQFGWGVR